MVVKTGDVNVCISERAGFDIMEVQIHLLTVFPASNLLVDSL